MGRVSLLPQARLVHLLSLEAGGERAEEIAPALRAGGYEVRLHGGPLPQLADAERLRAELAVVAAAARDALESGGLLLIADERGALVVPELLRLLLDERGLGWHEAWNAVSGATFARLGCPKNEPARPFWTAEFLEAEQPRLLEILYEVNRRHLEEVEARWRGDVERRRLLSLFREDATTKRLRTGILAVLASRRADVATPWEGPIGQRSATSRSSAAARCTPDRRPSSPAHGSSRATPSWPPCSPRRWAAAGRTTRSGASPHWRSAPSTPGSAPPSRPPAAPPAGAYRRCCRRAGSRRSTPAPWSTCGSATRRPTGAPS